MFEDRLTKCIFWNMRLKRDLRCPGEILLFKMMCLSDKMIRGGVVMLYLVNLTL